MGTFFSNCQVQSDSQEAVVKALTQFLKEPAYVSPAVGGWVGVYPEGTRTDFDKLAKQLSKQLSCGVFSWNVHDDDIFYYTLFEDGRRRDEFNSIPDYFEPVSTVEKKRLRGKPEALVPYCIPGIGSSKVLEVLHPPSRAESELAAESSAPLPRDIKAITKWLLEQETIRNYQSASGQAGGLAELFGMDWQLSSLSYRYIERGEATLEDGKLVLISAEMLSAKNRRPQLWELPMVADAIKAAIDLGADVNEQTEYGEPFLVLAAFKSAAEVVQLLLDSGADVNAATTKKNKHGWEERGWTALLAAVQGGANVASGAEAMNTAPQIKTTQLLINAGIDVNAKSETGWTALKEAQSKLKYFSAQKGDRWHLEESLVECVARNTMLVEMLRAAGATE